jgi:cytochrome c peroxidase
MDRTQQQAGAGRWITGVTLVVTVAFSGLVAGSFASTDEAVTEMIASNPAGIHRTVHAGGPLDSGNPFFQDLGTNGRTCFTCHRPAQAWTITPEDIRERFEQTAGLDPIFRTNDGSNCEGAGIATADDRRRAFSLLLTKGLIRVELKVLPTAEFEVVDVDDPYRCDTLFTSVSMYRRPLPTTNLSFLSTVMWDGRETMPGLAIRDDLIAQARSATLGHAEGTPPSAADLEAMVDFELGLSTAQTHDMTAGALGVSGARGGPRVLSREPFCIGINDPLGMLPSVPGACTKSSGFDPTVFTLFDAWADDRSPERRAIARGQAIFNTRRFVIDDVPGLNGRAPDPVSGPIQNGTCTVCHDTPNAGNHSVSMALNIGIADASRRTPDLPLYTLRNRTTGELVQTTDPGRAMVTGRWGDVGKFKGPVLRALAARAPFFHDGSAQSLADAVAFYDTRFRIGLTAHERADLIAFLQAL